MSRRSPVTPANALGWLAPCVQLGQMTFVAPQVVAYRTARILSGGWPPTARDRREYTRMVTEKADAFGQVATAVLALSTGAGPRAMTKTIESMHRKMMANHRRLSGR